MGQYFYIIPNVRSVWSVFYPYFVFSFFSSLCYQHFPWQRLTVHRIAGNGEGINVFLVFHLHSLTNINLVIKIPLFLNRSICNYHTDSWWDLRWSYWLHVSKWHCEDLSSYQIINVLLQSERLNQLTLTLLVTTAYLYTYPTLPLATAYPLSFRQNI